MFQRNTFVGLLLLSVFIYTQCASIESDNVETSNSKALARERRQIVTVPDLVTALGVFVGQLLQFVSNLLFILAGRLPVILGALGLGGLGLSLAVIVAQLGIIVGILSGRKRQSAPLTYQQAVTQLQAAITAESAANSLTTLAQQLNVNAALTLVRTQLEALQTALAASAPDLTTIRASLKTVLNNLDGAVSQIRTTITSLTSSFYSNIATISRGIQASLSYLQGLGANLDKPLKKNPSAVSSLFQNIANAQNQTFVSLNNFDIATIAITNVTIALLQLSTLQLGGISADALISSVPSILP